LSSVGRETDPLLYADDDAAKHATMTSRHVLSWYRGRARRPEVLSASDKRRSSIASSATVVVYAYDRFYSRLLLDTPLGGFSASWH